MAQNEMVRYFLGNMYKTKGYMHPADALLFATLLDHQRMQHVQGDLIEIGIYYGRSFCLLAKALGASERAIGIDLFAMGARGNAPRSESQQYKGFVQNLHKNQIDISKCSIHVGRSDAVDLSLVLNSRNKARFIHIDGGHDRDTVESDLASATRVLGEQGVIVLDDFFNPQWPGVTIAVLEFLAKLAEFVPFAITRGKLYVCRSTTYSEYSLSVSSAPLLKKFRKTTVAGFRVPIIFVMQNLVSRLFFEKSALVGLTPAAFQILR